MGIYIVVNSQLIYLKLKVMCVHLQKKSLSNPNLAEIEAKIKEYQGEEAYWEKKVNQHQQQLEQLISEKNKDEG